MSSLLLRANATRAHATRAIRSAWWIPRNFHAVFRKDDTTFDVYIPDNGSDQSFEQHLKFFKQVVYPLQMYTTRQDDIYVSHTSYDGTRHTYTFVVKRSQDVNDYMKKMDQMLTTKRK